MAGSSDKVFRVILGGCGHRFLPSIIVSSAVKDLTSPTNAVLLDASSSSVFAVVSVFVIASMPEHNSATSPSDMVLDLDPQTAEGSQVLLSESGGESVQHLFLPPQLFGATSITDRIRLAFH
jgi:hypothetical protein